MLQFTSTETDMCSFSLSPPPLSLFLGHWVHNHKSRRVQRDSEQCGLPPSRDLPVPLATLGHNSETQEEEEEVCGPHSLTRRTDGRLSRDADRRAPLLCGREARGERLVGVTGGQTSMGSRRRVRKVQQDQGTSAERRYVRVFVWHSGESETVYVTALEPSVKELPHYRITMM